MLCFFCLLVESSPAPRPGRTWTFPHTSPGLGNRVGPSSPGFQTLPLQPLYESLVFPTLRPVHSLSLCLISPGSRWHLITLFFTENFGTSLSAQPKFRPHPGLQLYKTSASTLDLTSFLLLQWKRFSSTCLVNL